MPKFTSTIVKSTLAGLAVTGALVATSPLAGAADWELTGSCTPGPAVSCVGGAPSYDGVPGLVNDLAGQTGGSCWYTEPYLATDGNWYDVVCF